MNHPKSYQLFFAFFLMIIFVNINTATTPTLPGGEDYLAFAEVMPEPVGGIEAVYKNVTYPKLAQQAGVQGKVFALVFVDENGSVQDAKVVKGIGAGCDEAVIDALKQSKFTPGKNKGQAVKVKLSMSFVFKLG